MEEKQIAWDEKPIKEIVKGFFKRLISLPAKFLSRKGVVFAVATYLLIGGYIAQWIWLSIAILITVGWEAAKWLIARMTGGNR